MKAHSQKLGNFSDEAVDNVSHKDSSDECLGGLNDDARCEASFNDSNSVNTATSNEDEEESHLYQFEGRTYLTYVDMVNAKRQRNHNYMKEKGLLKAKAAVDEAVREQKNAAAASCELKGATKKAAVSVPRRKSDRIAKSAEDNEQSKHVNIENESFPEDQSKGTFLGKTEHTVRNLVCDFLEFFFAQTT